MSRIIQAKMNMSPILENSELKYAVKHQEDGIGFKGIWQCDQFRDGELISGGYPEPPNIFPTVGLGRMLTVYFHDIAKAAEEIFYVGLFKANVTPAAGNTAATCLGAAGTYLECQDADYDLPLTDKPAYNTVDTATATITNAASKAEFTMAAEIIVYGAFLSTEKAKTATTGYLTAAKRFSASRDVKDNDVLSIAYEIVVSSS
ncbi:MAG: hypothetical protein ACT6FC_05415 [Methanosarcinaceae archaeon]